ncbi:MAG TPA: hypothetical protein VLW85_07490, partial [Myxococcales bacterium]|nr:hypothetical protein [Myxococcales bacterium]
MRRMLPALALVALAGCRCDTVPGNALVSCQSTQVLPASVQTDILFVIDDSSSMSEEQANLAANLDAFIDTLAASPVENDFRIGVTDSSITDFNGATKYAGGPSQGVPFPAGALVAVANNSPGKLIYDATTYASTAGWGGNRILDKGSPTLVADFKNNVRVGISGSGKEQPFRAARLALTDRLADANAGFLRDGARLAVIILSDADDCSNSGSPDITSNAGCDTPGNPGFDPVQGFADFLRGPVGGELRDVAVGAIAGLDPASLQPSCGNSAICSDRACSTAEAPGIRYVALAGIMGSQRMQLGSICDASFHDSLQRFAATLTPDTLPLASVPADWRMLVVSITKTDGAVVACKVGHQGDADQNT